MLFCISIVVWCGRFVRKPQFIFRSGQIIFTFLVRKFGSLIIVRIFGQTKEQNTMTSNFKYQDGTETFTFSELKDISKKNAIWEINQRNAVANFCGKSHKEDLTIENSLFYENGVFAKRK